MANTGSQAEAIRDLLIERLELFDPTLETGENSPLYDQVIQPVFDALGTDPFDTDIEQFLKDRLRQEYLSLTVTDGEPLVDQLVRPIQLLLEASKRETEIIRRGQSVLNPTTMRLEDAEALAANFFVGRRTGTRTSGVVRVYYSAPTYVSVLSTVNFSTPGGLRFFPIRPQFFSSETLLLQRSGSLFYADVSVLAEDVGDEYNVIAGEISRANGLPGATKVTNLLDFDDGINEEDATQLLDRTAGSLTERSLTTGRGIRARLFRDFPTLRNIEVVGRGDPEMERDVLTGGGHGRVVASGICFVVGQFCMMFSQFEDRGPFGRVAVQEGDEIDLNYWKWLYDVDPEDAHEVFTIESILFDTRDIFEEDLPSVLLFQLSGTPSAPAPASVTLPGVLPGVFAVIKTKGIIEISGIPGGILNPDTPRGTIVVDDGEVHIGGHYDVWVRPSSDQTTTIDLGVARSEAAFLEATDLFTCGGGSQFRNQVHRRYEVDYSVLSGTLQVGELVSVLAIDDRRTGAEATVLDKTETTILLGEFSDTDIEVGEVLLGRRTGARASVTGITQKSWEEDGVRAGMLLSILHGNDAGVYKILEVEGPRLYVDYDLTSSETDLTFRILDETTVDIFSPKEILLPFGADAADDLRTTIGSQIVRTDIDMLRYNIEVGDSLEILEGDDQGVYTVQSFDEALAGRAPVLSSRMTSTASGLRFQVYRPGTPLQAPLVRVGVGGVAVLDPSGQDSGNRVPYALPVEGRALEAFSGAGQSYYGRNGFVLMDPGPTWEPTGDLVGDPDEFEDVITGYSDEVLECDGWIAVVTFMDDGNFYLNSELPSSANQFLQDIRQWVLDIIEAFDLGDDAQAFVDGFHPFILGPPDTSVSNIMYQAEICIPREIFDGANNVFMALPEFDWQNEFEEQGPPFDVGTVTFSEVLDKFNSGELEGSGAPPALLQAKPGDALTVLGGNNTGAYTINKVMHYKLCHGGSLQDEGSGIVHDHSKCYDIALVVVDGSFPVLPLMGLVEFFEEGVPDLTVPAPPPFNVESIDKTSGELLGVWEVFESALTWVFQWLDSMGFDLPEAVTLDPGETLKAIWQLLFSEYLVGQSTCEQMVRLSFVEPTSFTAFGNIPSTSIQWNRELPGWPSVTGDEFTLPIPELGGASFTIRFREFPGWIVETANLPPEAGTTVDANELVGMFKEAIDKYEDHFIFDALGLVSTDMSVRAVQGGTTTKLILDAEPGESAFRMVGFYDDDTPAWIAHDTQFDLGSIEVPASNLWTNYKHVELASTGGFMVRFFATGIAPLEVSFTLSGSSKRTWEVVAAGMQIQLDGAITGWEAAHPGNTWTGTAELVSGTLAGRWALKVTVTHSGPNPFTGDVPETDAPATGTWEQDVFGGAVGWETGASQSGVTLNDRAGVGDFQLTVYSDGGSYLCEKRWTGFAEYADSALPDAIQACVDAGGDDYTQIVQWLNSDPDIYSSGSERRVVFVAPTDPSSNLLIRTLAGGDAEMKVQYSEHTAAGYQYLGFTPSASLEGTTATGIGVPDSEIIGISSTFNVVSYNPVGANNEDTGESLGEEEIDDLFVPPNPTMFSVVTGASELLFAASGGIDPFQVFPGETLDGKVPITELPRDITVDEDREGSTSTLTRYTDSSLEAPLAAGVMERSDMLLLYEHRVFLELTIYLDIEDAPTDRIIAVKTTFGSNVIELPYMEEPDFNFLDSTTSDPLDEVQVGDIVHFEEGQDAGGYLVVERSEFVLVLDTSMTESSGTVFRSGNDGIIEEDTALFTSATAQFRDSDIGRFLTMWATNDPSFYGSFRITEIEDLGTDSTATLDTDDFPATEQEIHWAIVRAPTEEGSSNIGGRTSLVGVRPVRIYSGAPSEHRVIEVSPHLDRTLSEIRVVHAAGSAPRQGTRQPFQIVRPGVQHISSTGMSGQGRELGLYWFDVLSRSLGGDAVHNIPEGTRMEPIFGTYLFEGYRLEVDDPNLVFSSNEDTRMVMSTMFLPTGFNDRVANKVSLEGVQLRVTHQHAPVVDQVQTLLVSAADRNLCSSPLARHFLPSYVYFDVNFSGGDTTTRIVADLIDSINNLGPIDDLDVSKLEKILHGHSVTRYDHPIYVVVVTHDLDRRLVGFRSCNKIGDDEVVFNGSNRISFFIPGPDMSSTDADTDIPDGERIYIVRGIPTSTLR